MNNNRPTDDQILMQKRREAYLRRQEEKQEKRSRRRKFFLLLIIFILVFVFYEKGFDFSKFKFDFKKFNFNFDFLKGKDSKKNSGSDNNPLDGYIAYIPMDDRDIHTTRIIYLAESGGYDLRMPDAKYFNTHIDKGENSYSGYSTKYGNPYRLSEWLIEQEENGCDYYIISLDQLFSGGILGSAYLDDTDFEVYNEDTIKSVKRSFKKIINDKNNHVYLIDSVVGLNVVPGFMNFTEADHSMLATYTALDRTELSGDNLTIEKIVENYTLDAEGKTIATDLNLEILNKYLTARERKLNLYDFVLEAIKKSKNEKNIHLYYGIDGSEAPSKNIQNNDLIYLRKALLNNKIEAPIKGGLSSLSEVVFTDLVLDNSDTDFKVKVSYYGDKDNIVPGTSVNYVDYMDTLLSDLGVSRTETEPSFEILVYAGVLDPATREENSNALLNKYLSNIKKHIPTVIVNNADYTQDRYLIENLIDYEDTSIPMGYLIGYSNWNGYINSARLGVSQGVTRYIYLNGKNKKEVCDKGFLKVMGEAFYEDIAYLPTDKSSNDLRKIEEDMEKTYKKITGNLSRSNYISNLVKYEEKGIKSLDTFNYSLPWGRINEISFDVTTDITDAHDLKIPDEVVYKLENKKRS